MTCYSYFNGEKWVIVLSVAELKKLAKQGVITEDTIIRDHNGNEALAKRFQGFEFSNKKNKPAETVPVPEKENTEPKSRKNNDNISRFLEKEIYPLDDFVYRFDNIVFGVIFFCFFVIVIVSGNFIYKNDAQKAIASIFLIIPIFFAWVVCKILSRLTEILSGIRRLQASEMVRRNKEDKNE